MSELAPLLWLIPALPLAASALTAFFGHRLKGAAHWPCVLAAAAAFVLSAFVFDALRTEPTAERLYGANVPMIVAQGPTWFQIGGVSARWSRTADSLSAVMLGRITF